MLKWASVIGISPVKEFELKSRRSNRCTKFPIWEGICPVNLLSLRFNYSRLTQLPSSSGKLARPFDDKSSFIKLGKLANSFGHSIWDCYDLNLVQSIFLIYQVLPVLRLIENLMIDEDIPTHVSYQSQAVWYHQSCFLIYLEITSCHTGPKKMKFFL